MSSNDKNPPPQIPDLLNKGKSHSSGIDDKKQPPRLVDLFPSGQLPKFSIRDYAFSSRRSKGVENSWPFSEKALQVCIKDGLENVLPPIEPSRGAVVSEKVSEPPEAVGKPTLGTIGSEKEKDDHGMFVDSDVAGCNLNPPILVEGANKESTCSDQIDSFPTRKSPESEAEILPEKSVPKPKPTATQAPVKKHRLAVKVGKASAKEDNPLNSFMVSQAMASKVCPVCETFPISSMTSLNAHIDQCLCVHGEPTAKWSSASEAAIENKIRSKKMKSMVEIYKSTESCTSEELERRNGSNLPAQGTDRAVATEQKKSKQVNSSPPANLEDIPDEGDVYIDENGAKVRILSKSSDQSSPPPKKVVTREKDSKFPISKKLKHVQLQKRQGRKKLSSRPRRRSFSKIDNDQDNFSGEESSEKEPRLTRSCSKRTEKEPRLTRSGSKRTEITKRSSFREGARRSAATGGETSFPSSKKRLRHENPELPLKKRLRHASMESQKRPNQEDSVSQIAKRKVQRSVGQVRKVDHLKPSSGPNTKGRMSSSPGLKSNLKRELSACKKSRVESSSDSEDQGGSFMLNSSSGGSSSSSDDDGGDEFAQKIDNSSDEEDFLAGFKNNREFHDADNSSDSDMDASDGDQKESETPHTEDQDPILNSQPDQEICGTEFPEINLNVTVTEQDGIPIPGPERMISEDLAGRSPLTSSRIQSSDDRHVLVDQSSDDRHELVDQSSDSPIPALSAISSPSTSMLRLMGKDLVVVNNEEPPLVSPPPSQLPGWSNAAVTPPQVVLINDGPENEPPPQPPRGLLQQPVTAMPSGFGFRPSGSSAQYNHPPGGYRGFWMGPGNAGFVNLNPPPEGSAVVHPNQNLNPSQLDLNLSPSPSQLNPNPPLKFYTDLNVK